MEALATKVKLTNHARQRIYERFGSLSDRELSDLVRNARLKGNTTTTMDQEHYEYGLYKHMKKVSKILRKPLDTNKNV